MPTKSGAKAWRTIDSVTIKIERNVSVLEFANATIRAPNAAPGQTSATAKERFNVMATRIFDGGSRASDERPNSDLDVFLQHLPVGEDYCSIFEPIGDFWGTGSFRSIIAFAKRRCLTQPD